MKTPSLHTLLASAMLFGTVAFAADGDLDTTYNTPTGFNSVSFGASDNVYGGILQPDGKLIVIGGARPVTNQELSVARYNADGTLDTATFGGGTGKYSLDVNPATTTDRGTCGGLQSDGKIIIGGYTRVAGGNDDFAIIRLNTNGTLDTTFGTSGITKVEFNGGTDRANDLVVLSDGSIVVVGMSSDSFGSLDIDYSVAKLTANGALDATFGTGGKATVDIGDQQDTAYRVTVQPDGKILLAGQSLGSVNAGTVIRLSSTGVLDTSFGGGDGYFSAVNALRDVRVQSDGKIMACGDTGVDSVLVRLTSSGVLDTSFNTTGSLTLNLSTNSDFFQTVIPQADGKYVAGGISQNNTFLETALVRVTSAGALDPAFGTGGIKEILLGTGSNRVATIHQASDGKILVSLEGGASSAENFIAARFHNTVAVASAPEIAVTETGVGAVADGGSFSFGSTTVGTPVTKTFTVTNSGTATLNLSGLTVPSGFTIAANFASTVPASGGTTSFQITMSAGAEATPSGTLTFVTDDADENPYNFTISGTVNPTPMVVIQPTAVLANPPLFGTYVPQNSINKVGLNPSYTSGVTDYTTYVASNPVQETLGAILTTYVFTADNNPTGDWDYDLGATYALNRFLFWNTQNDLATYVKTFEILVDDNSAFSSPESAGTFSAFTTITGSPDYPSPLEVFSLTPRTGRYVRFRVLSNNSSDPASRHLFGELAFAGNAVSAPAAPEIAVTETGVGAVADGGSFSFGTTTVGTPVTKTFTVTNSGDATLNLSGLTVPSGFTIAANFGTTTVAASGGTTTFQITMSAGAAATPSGTLTFVTDDADENPYNFTISGTVTAPAITGTMMFTQDTGLGDGIAQDGEAGSSDIPGITMQVLNITDTAGTNLGLMSWKNNVWLGSGDAGYSALTYDQNAGTKGMAIKSSDGSEFQLNQFLYYNWGETSSTTITIKGYRNTVEVASTTFAGWINTLYMPITVNLDSTFDNVDDVRLYISAGGYQGDQSATNHSINNIVIAPPVAAPAAPEIAVMESAANVPDGGSLSFGTTTVGSPVTKTFTITNSGDATLNLSNLTVPSGFTIAANFASTVPASGGTTSFQITMSAGAAATPSGTLSFTNDDANENPYNFTISGTVNPPPAEIAVSYVGNDVADGSTVPATLNGTAFGDVPVQGVTVDHVFTITNSGGTALTLGAVTAGGDFTVTQPTSPVAANGGTTSFTVSFNPSTTGLRTATVSFTNSDANESPFTFDVSGTGTPAQTFDLAGNAISNTPFDGGETYIYVTNTAPVITSNGGGPTASVNVAENSTTVTNVTANDTDLPAQTLTYSITGGADSTLFNIDSGSGVLSFTSSRNFEVFSDADTNGIYEVTVTATDNGAGLLSDSQALSITITNVNEMPVFTKGADQLLPYNTSSAQTATGWATGIDDGDSTVTQALTFNISSNTNPGLFSTAPTINSGTGTLTYTPNGTAGTATIGVTLTDDATINGNAALTSGVQTFTITVQAAPDYTVATTGNVIVVTDLSGNGDTLAVSEPSAGNIQFAAAGRTFSVDGGLQIAGNSGAISRTSVTAITVNAAAGTDTINVGAFTGTLPNFTLNGGTGDDTANLNGDITFAANASLDLDLQNDDVTPGVDIVSVASNANILTSGTGTITVKVSRNVALASGSSLETVNGNLTIEANQQGTATTGGFVGVDVSNGLIRATGTGVVTVLGRGGNSAAGNQMGVRVTNGGDILGGTSGTLTVTGTGGASSGGGNLGVNVFGSATTTISSIGANVQVTGTGGTGGSTAIGVELGTGNTGGRITAGGSGTVTVTGTGGSSVAGLFNHGILMGSATIDSGGGNVSVTGNGGSGNGSTGDHTGIQLDDSTVTAGGSGSVTVVGNAGSAATSQTLLGVDVRFTSTITSSGGNVSVTGTGGNTSNALVGAGAGVRLIGNGTITAGGTGTVSVTGTGVGGSAIGHEGVVVNGSGLNSNQARIGAANGTTSVTATAGNSASTALVVGTVNAGRISTGSNNAITLTADRMAFGGSAIISSGTGATTLVQRTNGALINLGAADSAGTLGLTDTELDRVTCGTLVIGNADSGSVTVSAPITRTASTAMQIISAADILISGGQINTAGGNLLLDSGISPAAVKPTLAGTDVTVGTLSFGSDLQIAIAGTTADSDYTQLNVVGSVDLTGVTLALTGAHVPLFGQSFTIVNNDGTDAIIGTFTGLSEGDVVTFNGIPLQISYVGGTDSNDVVLRVYMPEIVVHDGSHTLAPELSDGQVAAVNFGSTSPNAASVRSFTVTNDGNADLSITSITVPAAYTSTGAATVLAPGTTYTFQVALESATPATYTGSITINNDDLNEPAFDFPVTGTVVPAGSAPVVTVSTDVAVEGPGGAPVLGGPVGSTIYKFIGSPALNSSGVLASAVQIRHADTSLHTGMMVGQPLALIATDSQTAPSLPGVTHYNFGPPVINEVGHIAFTGEVRGAGITTNVNSRCLFSNASDGVLKLVAQVGTATTLGSNLKTIGNFSIGGDLIIFLGTLVDNSIVLFGWDANTGIRPLMRNGQSLDANGVTKTVKNFSILETGNASSGHGREISVAPTGESLVTLNVTFTDNSSGVVLGSFDGTSDTGFGATYGASQQLADTYAAPGVIPLAKWNTFRSPGFDNTGSYYGFISQMVTNTLAGVTSTNNVGIFVDTAPGLLTLQLRENDVATDTGGLVFSDFSDLVLGGGDYEFLVKGEVRGSGVVVNVNDKGLWAQHATNGLVLVAREGSEAPGVAGSTFFRLTQIALPGTAQPMFQASMTSGVGGVTAANDTGLWVINAGEDVVLAVREGDVLNVGGTDRSVTAITALLNGTTTGGALGRRVFLADGQLTLLLTFSGGVQANAKVVVP